MKKLVLILGLMIMVIGCIAQGTRIPGTVVIEDVLEADTIRTKGGTSVIIVSRLNTTQVQQDQDIDDLQDRMTTAEDDISDLESSFDTMYVSADHDTVYAEYDGLLLAWLVTGLVDNSPPYYVSSEIGNVGNDDLVITMNEPLYPTDSITECTSSSQTWDRMTHWWKLESVSSSTDQIGSNDLTATGMTQITGKDGNGWDVEIGGTDYADMDAGINVGSQDISVGAWINRDNYTNNGAIVGGPSGSFFFGTSNNGELMVQTYGSNYVETSGLNLPTGSWIYVGCSYDQSANEILFYYNGNTEVETYTDQFTANTDAVASRGSGESQAFDGYIDEVHIGVGHEWVSSRFDSLYNSGTFVDYDEMGGGETCNQTAIKGAFTVTVGGTGVDVDTVTTSGSTITLDLASDAGADDVVTVAYTAPTYYASIRDTSGNAANSWTAESATNNVTATGGEVYFDIIYEMAFDDWGNDASFDFDDMESYAPGTYSINYMQTPAIVSDNINGSSTSVLRITHAEGYPTSSWLYSGLDWKLRFANQGDNYTDLFMSSNLKLRTGAITTPDLKLPGFKTYPAFSANTPPDPGYGYLVKGYAQYQFEFNSYVYDRTYNYAPWAFGESADSVYLIPGVWYNITERLTQNEYGSYNGVAEFAIDGVWSNQRNGMRMIVDDTATINGFGIGSWTGGGWDDGNQLIDTYYMYVDNVTVWTPNSDPVYGTRNYHNPDNIYIVPDSIVSQDLDYDGSIITTETTITNSEWGSYYSAGVDEQYLIDAGAGNTVTITANSGGVVRDRDILLITNGKTSDAGILGKITGRSISSGETFTSTGRYMHLWFGSWNEGGGYDGWSFNITHNP